MLSSFPTNPLEHTRSSHLSDVLVHCWQVALDERKDVWLVLLEEAHLGDGLVGPALVVLASAHGHLVGKVVEGLDVLLALVVAAGMQ